MYEIEVMIFFISMWLTIKFLIDWYKPIIILWPPDDFKKPRAVLGCLPLLFLVLTLINLMNLSSFDVQDSAFYIGMYLLLGFLWQYICIYLIRRYFDISWEQDALQRDNQAALVAFTGAFVGTGLIYNGANMGDGPGWWCVVFAGGLGVVTWILLGVLINKLLHVSESITVERDLGSGIRFGGYLVASGIILARASAGDWTSAGRTVFEFLAGWPVLALAGIMILVENAIQGSVRKGRRMDEFVGVSVFWAVLFIVLAVVVVLLLPPTTVNPIYG